MVRAIRLLVLVPALFLLTTWASAQDQKEDIKEVLDKLQGQWRVVSYSAYDMTPETYDITKPLKVTIKGHRFEGKSPRADIKGDQFDGTNHTGKRALKFTFKLIKPGETWTKIDLTWPAWRKKKPGPDEALEQGTTKGICKFDSDGDRLEILWGAPGEARLDEKEKTYGRLVLKRVD